MVAANEKYQMSINIDTWTKIIKQYDRSDISLYTYSNKDDFEKLWNLFDSKPPITDRQKTFFIIWDGIPLRQRQQDRVNISKYLTPIDWAVAFSIYILDTVNNQNLTCPDLRIIIFNVSSKSFTESDSLQYANHFPKRDIASMPWIRIFSPGDSNEGWNVEDLFNDLTGNTDSPVCSMKDFSKKKNDLGFLKNMWVAFLTRPSTPGDHHAIANLIGPLLLMGDNTGEDQHVNALRSLMKTLGLIPKKEKTEAFPWIKWGDAEGKLNLILIDDQYHQGWGQVLCQAVGTEYKETDVSIRNLQTISIENDKVTVRAASSCDWMLDKLTGDQRFSLVLDEENIDAKQPEILFLDLRLFSGKDEKVEAVFFKRLIPLAEKFIEDGTTKLPWKGFTIDDIVKVMNWTKPENQKREDNDYIIALTLLPRILALTDLSLPIIIFSSTGRRDITEILKPYGNIITAFDKPKFTVDIPFDIAAQTKGKFQEALEMGIKILQGRQICKKVKHLGDIAQGSPHLVPSGTIMPRFKHIEIYIDETGRSGQKLFTLGGLVIAYPEYEDVFKLDEELKLQKVYWYSSNSADTEHLSKRPNKQNKKFQGACAKIAWKYKDAAKTLLSLSGKSGCFVTAVCINDILDAYNNPHDRHFPLKDLSSDARYVRVLSMLIELILFEMIPAWVKNSVTISIFPCTRIAPVQLDKKHTLARSEKPLDYFGFRPAPTDLGKPQNYYTIGAESIVSYVSHVIDSRHDLPAQISVHHSRGVTLTYGVPSSTGKNNLMWDNIRVQNYFADIVIGNKDVFGKQYALGFDANADADLYTLVEAQHELQNDNLSLAIELMSSCEQVKEKMHGHIAKKIAGSLNVISGSDYTHICQSSNLSVDDGGSGVENGPIDKREVIIVQVVTRNTYSNRIQLRCRNTDNNEILVTEAHTKKLGIEALSLKKGDRLLAVVVSEYGKLYGKDIALA